MAQRFVEIDGKELRMNNMFILDHRVDTFTVSVKSLNGVGENTLRDLIQSKFEVQNIERVDSIFYGKAS